MARPLPPPRLGEGTSPSEAKRSVKLNISKWRIYSTRLRASYLRPGPDVNKAVLYKRSIGY